MELDDLRQQWRQPPLAPSAPPSQLADILKRTSGSAIDRMRRNTWNEISIVAITVIANFGLLLSHKGPVSAIYATLLGLVVVLMTIYYVLQINLLKRMAQTDSNVRGHLREVCVGLRKLLRFSDKLTLWTGPVTLLVLLFYYAEREVSQTAVPRWSRLALVMGAGILLGAGLQVGILKLNRWWSQYRYGQHLDRLESQLRELNEVALPDAAS